MLEEQPKKDTNPKKDLTPDETTTKSSGTPKNDNVNYITSSPSQSSDGSPSTDEKDRDLDPLSIREDTILESTSPNSEPNLESDNRCEWILASGSRCLAGKLKDDSFCWFHSERLAESRREAQERGGKAKQTPLKDYSPKPIKTPTDLEKVLEQAIHGVLLGTLPPRTGAVISSLATALIRVMDIGTTEKRLEAVEQKLKERRSG